MKYDADRVGKLSSEIYNALDGLKEISQIDKDDFLKQRHIIAGANIISSWPLKLPLTWPTS